MDFYGWNETWNFIRGNFGKRWLDRKKSCVWVFVRDAKISQNGSDIYCQKSLNLLCCEMFPKMKNFFLWSLILKITYRRIISINYDRSRQISRVIESNPLHVIPSFINPNQFSTFKHVFQRVEKSITDRVKNCLTWQTKI